MLLGVRLLYSSTTRQYQNVEELGAMSGHRSEVRALAAQASNLGLILSLEFNVSIDLPDYILP